MLQGVTGGYNGLQGVTRGDRGLQVVIGGLQGVTVGCKGLQGVTKVYRSLFLTKTFADTLSWSILQKNQS